MVPFLAILLKNMNANESSSDKMCRSVNVRLCFFLFPMKCKIYAMVGKHSTTWNIDIQYWIFFAWFLFSFFPEFFQFIILSIRHKQILQFLSWIIVYFSFQKSSFTWNLHVHCNCCDPWIFYHPEKNMWIAAIEGHIKVLNTTFLLLLRNIPCKEVPAYYK